MSAAPFLLGHDDDTGVSLFDSLRNPDLSAFGYDATQDWSFLSQPKHPGEQRAYTCMSATHHRLRPLQS
jgi:hypothetical protein